MAVLTGSQSQKIQEELNRRKKHQLIRQRQVVSSRDGIYLQQGNNRCVNFSSNDYLLLSQHTDVKQAAVDAVNKFGLGGNASALVSGYSDYHKKLEEQFAEFIGYEKAIVFSSGYQASMAVLSTLAVKSPIFLDKFSHASLLDAARAATSYWRRYLHNDINSLDMLLEKINQQSWVITDGVFSMDGDVAPVKKIVDLKKEHCCKIYLDDAHGFGVLGGNGKGVLEYSNVNPESVDIYMTTFGKALGTNGAVICTDEQTAEAIIQLARPYIYTTAISPVIAAATAASLSCIMEDQERRHRLKNNIEEFVKTADVKGLKTTNSFTAIQSIIIGDIKKTLSIAEKLKEKGFLVAAIREPTVPTGTSRLRVSICSEHKSEHIQALLEETGHCIEMYQ